MHKRLSLDELAVDSADEAVRTLAPARSVSWLCWWRRRRGHVINLSVFGIRHRCWQTRYLEHRGAAGSRGRRWRLSSWWRRRQVVSVSQPWLWLFYSIGKSHSSHSLLSLSDVPFTFTGFSSRWAISVKLTIVGCRRFPSFPQLLVFLSSVLSKC